MAAAKKSKAQLQEALAAFIATDPPLHGSGSWVANALTQDERDLIEEMHYAGFGGKYIARFLVSLGHQEATAGRIETFTSKLVKKS